jgi:gamma-glutamylcyclotransferase (GGCT)/AIG2-like uncharacterized protein YtfP
MMAKTVHLFVYGTLRPPQPGSIRADSFNYPKIENKIHQSQPAWIQDAEIYDLGSFPGARPGTGRVAGEVLELEPDVFSLLDPLEGHPEVFRREQVVANTPEGPVEAWIYWAPADLTAGREKISGGDWLHRRGG